MTVEPHRRRRLVPWDEAPLVRNAMSRARFMELYRALRVTPPSRQVTSAEVARAVSGEQPPEWAADRQFEAELEGLIVDHSVVWICCGCDLVIGFLDIAAADVAEGTLVAHSSGLLRCPRCPDGMAAWWDPEVLTLGEPVALPATDDPEDAAPPPADPPTASERFLDEVIAGGYDAPGGRLDTLEISAPGHARYQRIVAESPAGRLGEIDVRPFDALSLRPGRATAGVDLIGPHWERALDVAGPGYGGLAGVAVGGAPSPGIAASAHHGPAGELAIVVELGLFTQLPTLANWLSRIFDDATDGRSLAAVDELVRNVVRLLSGDRDTPVLDYGSHDQVLRARFVTDAQICFALLHELGHVVDWTGAAPARDPFDIEAEADAWAMRRLLERGERHFLPWMLYRSVFWLFEYWWLMAVGGDDERPTFSRARERWDRLERLIGSSGGVSHLDRLYRKELRMIFDLVAARRAAEGS